MQSSIFLSNAGFPALSLAVGTALFTGTEYCLKRTVDTGDWSYYPTAMVLSVIANGFYLFVVKEYGVSERLCHKLCSAQHCDRVFGHFRLR